MLKTQILSLTFLVFMSGCGGGDAPVSKSTPSSADVSNTAASGSTKESTVKGRFIRATPNPVHVEGKSGTTTIEWDTGDDSDAQVYLCPPDKEDQLFTGGAKGSQVANWIVKNGRYEFALYAGKEHKTKIATVIVTSD